MGPAAVAVCPDLLEIRDRARGVAATVEVDRQLRCQLVGARSVRSFEGIAGAFVGKPRAGRRAVVVKDAAVQLVAESVAARHRAVWPLPGAGRAKELALARERVATPLHGDDVLLHRGGDAGRRKVRACRAGGLQEEPIRVVQTLGLPIDHQAEALRDAELGVVWLDAPPART